MEQLQERNSNLESERAIWQQQVHSRQSPPQQVQLPVPTSATTREPSPVSTMYKKKLPDPPKFAGEPEKFRQFTVQLEAKLEVDAGQFANDREKTFYAFGLLDGRAAAQVLPWLQACTTLTPQGLLEQLKVACDDPARVEKAAQKIRTMRQGNQSFGTFLSDFNQNLLDAGGYYWDDSVKRMLLSGAVNLDLRKAMAIVPQPERYSDLCTQYQKVWDELSVIKTLYRPTSTNAGQQWASRRSSPPPLPERMDWQPTTSANQVGRKKATWVTREEIDLRRKNNRCIRCGAPRRGHVCQLDPAERPKTQVNHVSTQEYFLLQQETQRDADIDAEDQGKE